LKSRRPTFKRGHLVSVRQWTGKGKDAPSPIGEESCREHVGGEDDKHPIAVLLCQKKGKRGVVLIDGQKRARGGGWGRWRPAAQERDKRKKHFGSKRKKRRGSKRVV